LLVLDEASSALDVETENEFYQLCDSFGITLISVGHRENLRQVGEIMSKTWGLGSIIHEAVVHTYKNAQVVTDLQQTCSNAVPTTCQQDVFALLLPSLLTTCQRLADNLQGC
jgi:ABC-type uncharacterized transport system fused permease/ATPase subunit